MERQKQSAEVMILKSGMPIDENFNMKMLKCPESAGRGSVEKRCFVIAGSTRNLVTSKEWWKIAGQALGAAEIISTPFSHSLEYAFKAFEYRQSRFSVFASLRSDPESPFYWMAPVANAPLQRRSQQFTFSLRL